MIQVGVVGYTSQKLYGPDDRGGTRLLTPTQGSITILGEAFAALRVADLAVFVVSAVDGVAFEIAFERGAVDFDVLDDDGLRPGNNRRDFGLNLCGEGSGEDEAQCGCEESGTLSHGPPAYLMMPRSLLAMKSAR